MKMEDGIVVAYEELSKEELLQLKSELEAQFDEVKAKNLAWTCPGKPVYRTAEPFHGYDGCIKKRL